MLGDAKTLRLLGEFETGPFTNSEARVPLGMKRQAAWKRLARLSETGLVEKRGHSYRVSSFAKDFVLASSNTLQSLILGKELAPRSRASDSTSKAALEGLEVMYAKGRLSEDEYRGHRKALQEMLGVV